MTDFEFQKTTIRIEYTDTKATARYALIPKSFMSRITREGIMPGDQTPYRGDGTLTIQISQNPSQMGLKIVDVRAVETPDDSTYLFRRYGSF